MKPPDSPIRQFLYLDVPLVTDSLSQMEGGSYDSETRTTEVSRSRGLKGEVGVGVPFVSMKGGGGKDKGSREEIQRIVERTDAVRFAQLYSLLTDQSKIQELSTADLEIWEQLEPGEFVDIRATVTLSTVAKTVDVLIVRSKWLADMLTKFRYDARPISSTQSLSDRHELAIVEPSGQTTTRRRSVSGLMQRVLSPLNGIEPLPKLEVIALLIGSPDYKFVAHLDRDHLLVTSPVELAGEVQVLGRLEQKLKSPYRTGGLSPEVIEWLQGLIEKNALSQSWVETAKHLYVEPPVAVFQPVAIYR